MNFFKHQEAARTSTAWLVIFFLLAVLSLIALTNLLAMLVFGYTDTQTLTAESEKFKFDWDAFVLISLGVLGLVSFGSLYKIMSLSGGGARVAEMMDATLVVDDDGDVNKKKILNVVEEMAIASGTPVPPVYLLDEDAINAFAAGYTSGDAVIGITRGAIEKLSRDQLQGVIAHEFSHISNGDMRLNIRLIGILHGILIIGLIGYYLLRTSSYSRSSKNSGGVVILGLGLMVIGYAGTFFGNLIKAAVSRQREYLADASAVQFTRNPDGIADALKRIGGDATGSILQNPNGSEINHALFSEGISSFLGGIFDTHPPLKKRILAIQPRWDGKYDYALPETANTEAESIDEKASDDKKSVAMMAALAATIANGGVVQQVGQPTETHIDYAHQLIEQIPEALISAVHEPFAARAVIYFLVLDDDDEFRKKQLHHLMTSANPGVYREIMKLVHQVTDMKAEYRLPLVDMALSSLRQLSKKQYALFKDNLTALMEIDSKINLMEWSLQKIVFTHLDNVYSKSTVRTYRHCSLNQAKNSCAILLSLVIHAGGQKGTEAKAIFDAANEKLGNLDIQLVEEKDISLSQLNQAIDELVRLKPLKKPQLLKAYAACITTDQKVTPAEGELFRAIADTLNCPMPPLIV